MGPRCRKGQPNGVMPHRRSGRADLAPRRPDRDGPRRRGGAAVLPPRAPSLVHLRAPSPASRTVLRWPPGTDASPAGHRATLESNFCSTHPVDLARAATSSRMPGPPTPSEPVTEAAQRAAPWCDDAVTTAPARHLVTLGPGDLADRLSEALQVYVAAMGYPPSTARQRRALWLDHVRRPGWRAAGWLDDRGALLGVAYGYTGGPGQWWYEEVRRGLRGTAAEARGWLRDYFELTELHVRPDAQGAGLGEGLLRALLAGVAASPGAAVHARVRRPVAGPRLAALPAHRASRTCCATTASPATPARSLRQCSDTIRLLMEPAALLAGRREYLADCLPESQGAVADCQHRGGHPRRLQSRGRSAHNSVDSRYPSVLANSSVHPC